jgi:hypothetical protein
LVLLQVNLNQAAAERKQNYGLVPRRLDGFWDKPQPSVWEKPETSRSCVAFACAIPPGTA